MTVEEHSNIAKSNKENEKIVSMTPYEAAEILFNFGFCAETECTQKARAALIMAIWALMEQARDQD